MNLSAIVLPLHKKGAKEDLRNYRPISLLPGLSKVFEKAMKTRMLNFLQRSNFLSPKQFGFRKKLSTEDALVDFCSHILKALDAKTHCASLFVDITKAFDMVDHNILLRKLNRIGFRGNVYNWLLSYLSNRTQQVKIGNSLSYPVVTTLGVPQGSVLGPLLFLIYINSIFSQNLRGNVTAFADDLGLSYSAANLFELICDINYDVSILRSWFMKHKLVISNKTRLMFYSLTPQDVPAVDIIYHDPCCLKLATCNNEVVFNDSLDCHQNCFKIEKVENFKYLGVHIDCNFSWKKHCESLKFYFRNMLRKFYQLAKMCSPTVLKMFYYGLFHSKLIYGIACWGGAYANKIAPLQVVQKAVIRKICNVRSRTPSYELFKTLNILPIRHLFYYKALQVFIKNDNFRIIPTPSYNLRHSSNVLVPPFRTTSIRNSFMIVSRRLFNTLPLSIKRTQSFNAFSRALKSWLLCFNVREIESILDPLV